MDIYAMDDPELHIMGMKVYASPILVSSVICKKVRKFDCYLRETNLSNNSLGYT